jgi:hypothetical protein
MVDLAFSRWNQIIIELKKWQEVKSFGTAELRLGKKLN